MKQRTNNGALQRYDVSRALEPRAGEPAPSGNGRSPGATGGARAPGNGHSAARPGKNGQDNGGARLPGLARTMGHRPGPPRDCPGDDPVSTIMSGSVPVVRDTLDVDHLARFLLERQLSGAAVADERGILVGYVSLVALVRQRYLDGDTASAEPVRRGSNGDDAELRSGSHMISAPATVRDIMTPHILRLPADTPIDHAAAVMAYERVHQVIIVSPTEQLVGALTSLDLLRWVARRDGYAVPGSSQSALPSAFEYAFRSGREERHGALPAVLARPGREHVARL